MKKTRATVVEVNNIDDRGRVIPKVHPRRDELITAIARFICTDMGRKSIELEMGKSQAMEWAAVKNNACATGYPTQAEAEAALRRVLGITA